MADEEFQSAKRRERRKKTSLLWSKSKSGGCVFQLFGFYTSQPIYVAGTKLHGRDRGFDLVGAARDQKWET